jgi:hypothetical protein
MTPFRRVQLSADENWGTHFNLVIEFFDVGDRHPHATVRGGAAERAIQAALIGFDGPGGIVCPARSPAQSESGTCQIGFSSFAWIS